MRALVVYESIYGNTHEIASAIAEGLAATAEVRVVPVAAADAAAIAWADLVVAGGPTHARGMTRVTSRRSAIVQASKPDSPLHLDPAAGGPGIRDWLDGMGHGRGARSGADKHGAGFDTRFDGPALLTGRAAASVARGLRQAGFAVHGDGESFLINGRNQLVAGERDRAVRWGAALGADIWGTAPVLEAAGNRSR
jgi:hypothetical protein